MYGHCLVMKRSLGNLIVCFRGFEHVIRGFRERGIEYSSCFLKIHVQTVNPDVNVAVNSTDYIDTRYTRVR